MVGSLSGRMTTQFYDVAIGAFDQSIQAVKDTVGRASGVHVWIKEPLPDWRLQNNRLQNGEIRRAARR
jgi:hypothetical protein